MKSVIPLAWPATVILTVALAAGCASREVKTETTYVPETPNVVVQPPPVVVTPPAVSSVEPSTSSTARPPAATGPPVPIASRSPAVRARAALTVPAASQARFAQCRLRRHRRPRPSTRNIVTRPLRRVPLTSDLPLARAAACGGQTPAASRRPDPGAPVLPTYTNILTRRAKSN